MFCDLSSAVNVWDIIILVWMLSLWWVVFCQGDHCKGRTLLPYKDGKPVKLQLQLMFAQMYKFWCDCEKNPSWVVKRFTTNILENSRYTNELHQIYGRVAPYLTNILVRTNNLYCNFLNVKCLFIGFSTIAPLQVISHSLDVQVSDVASLSLS